MQSNAKEPTEAQKKALETKVKQSDLELIVELGTSSITIEEFLTMGIGDVIQLDKKINEPLILKIGDIPKFTVQPGKLKKKMAVQIIESLNGGEEDE
jgi:flagellar motor switch protein FliM